MLYQLKLWLVKSSRIALYPRLKDLQQLGLILLVSSIVASPVTAQTVEQASPPSPRLVLSQASFPPPDLLESPSRTIPSPETPAPLPVLPPPEELLRSPVSPPDVTQPSPDDVPATITVERFEVVGSTVFNPEELAVVTKPFTQRPISLAELFQARSAVTQLYVERGYITSGAYIPPQQLRDGVVRIQIIEGTLEEIAITGTQRLKPTYVRNRLAIATKQPLNRDRLLEALQLLQLNPLIENLSAELSAGTRPGQSILEIRVSEAETFNTQVTLDNGRSPSVGTFRRRLQLSEANLLGLGDGLSAAYSNTAGSNSLDTSYTLPLNARNGTLNFAYGTSSSQVIEEPFDQLDIDANSRYYELTLRQPLVETPREEFTIGLTASRRESQASLLGGDIPFPALGADEQGKTRISALRFFQEWTRRSNREVLAARFQFNLGLDALNATISDTEPDSRFFAWRGQGQWVRLLAPDTLLLLRTDVQLANRSLVPLEQFGLGGQETVRGYRQDLLLADNGLFASAEMRLPIARIRQWDSVLQLTPFVDFGTAWNWSDREEPAPNTLASVGLGLRWQMGDRLTARFDWGIPLVSVDASKDTWQENGLYFSVTYNPF